MSFDRFKPADAVQFELPWRAPDSRQRVVRLKAAVDALNSRYGRTLIGYGQCLRRARRRGRLRAAGGKPLVGTPRVGFSASEYGRDYRVGYGLGVLDRERLNFELGFDAQRRESPLQGGTSNGVLGRASLGW